MYPILRYFVTYKCLQEFGAGEELMEWVKKNADGAQLHW